MEIGDHAWLGQNVVILPGVTVGAGAVVGANSVVGEDVAPRTVVVGAPARLVRELPSLMPVGEAEGELPSADLLDTAAAGPAAVRGGALRIAGYVAASLLALGSGAVLYHYLGVVESGRYTAAGSLVALVAAASDLGLTAIGLRELAIRRGEERVRMAGTLLGLRLLITCVGVIAVTIFALIAYGLTLGVGVALAGVGLMLHGLAGHAGDPADGRHAPGLDLAAGIPAPAAAVDPDRRASCSSAPACSPSSPARSPRAWRCWC